jgi:Heterokaryon incompatibility protein (HET)
MGIPRRLYKDLSVKHGEIRLLNIVDVPSDDRLVTCQLTMVSLHEKPSFVALSYVWGDANITKDILVDEQKLAVTTNLESALRFVTEHWKAVNPGRDPDTFRIWADAVYINQQDRSEKENQISLMREIYQQADVVFSWLGPEDNRMSLGFRAIRVLSDEFRDLNLRELAEMRWWSKYAQFMLEDQNTTLQDSAMVELFWIVSLPYWKRVWVFQELILGKEFCSFPENLPSSSMNFS